VGHRDRARSRHGCRPVGAGRSRPARDAGAVSRARCRRSRSRSSFDSLISRFPMPVKELTNRRRMQLTQDRVTRVHQPAFLKDVSLGFSNPALIAERVCPTIGVAKQSDLYRVFGRNTMRTHETRWAPGTVPNAIQMRWSSDQYFCDLRKLRIALTDAERNNADSDLDLEA